MDINSPNTVQKSKLSFETQSLNCGLNCIGKQDTYLNIQWHRVDIPTAKGSNRNIRKKMDQRKNKTHHGKKNPEAPNQTSWSPSGFFCSPEGLAGLVLPDLLSKAIITSLLHRLALSLADI